MQNRLYTIENFSDQLLFVCNEIDITIESNNRRSWSPIGESLIIGKNGKKEGLKIIGATEISKDFKSYITAYPYNKSITSEYFIEILKYLLKVNEEKKISVILVQYKFFKQKMKKN